MSALEFQNLRARLAPRCNLQEPYFYRDPSSNAPNVMCWHCDICIVLTHVSIISHFKNCGHTGCTAQEKMSVRRNMFAGAQLISFNTSEVIILHNTMGMRAGDSAP